MDTIRDYIQEHGDKVFEVAKKEANQNTVFSIGNDPLGDTTPVALLSSAYGPDNKRSKLRRLEQFLRSVGTQRQAVLLGVTERQYIAAATAWFDDFYRKNAKLVLETTTTAGVPTMSGGMRNALRRRFRDSDGASGVCCPHPDCGFSLPKYPGRYPKTCPLCGQNMTEGAKKEEFSEKTRALATRALKAMEARRGEDIRAWARRLADDSVKAGESEYE